MPGVNGFFRSAFLVVFQVATLIVVGLTIFVLLWVVRSQPDWRGRASISGFLLSTSAVAVCGLARVWHLRKGGEAQSVELARRLLRWSWVFSAVAAGFLLLVWLAFNAGAIV